ncbi:CUB and sushi domain-containing protein 3 [Halotydeus destructor]|nr:CUB and sushi domain-containing protein 3 [Halotydeus destructor]
MTLSEEHSIRAGSIVNYRCDDGYELFGPSVRTCNQNGRWSDELPYCAVNVAYGKPTNQSSSVRGGDARNANDGDTSVMHEGSKCTETKSELSPWWMVDLLQPYEVRVIRLMTRGCCGHQPLHDLEIRVGNSSVVSENRLCAWYPGTLEDGVTKDLPCAAPIKGRFVFIQMVGVEASLSLCETLVFTTKEFSADRCGSPMEHQQLVSFNQTCYEFQTQHGGSFADAQDYCKARGGYVVNEVVNVTQNFLYYELERLKSKLKSRLVWLGAKRELSTNHPAFHRSRSNVWKWTSGSPVASFLWAEDQPNNYNGQQNCIVLDGGRKWMWNDVTCDLDYLPWICQYTPSNCGSPDKRENSTILEFDYRIGRDITYRCPTGYKVDGNETRKCQADGFWSSVAPSCQYVDCGVIPDISKGRVVFLNDSRTSFNATALYKCDRDYTLVGNETRVCLGNGSWSGSEPKCLYSWCPDLYDPVNGLVKISNRTENGTAEYTCARGHKLLGNGTRHCQLGGKWTGEEPTCKYIDCGKPLDLQHGRFKLLNGTTSYGSLIQYTCAEHYSFEGNGTRNCTQFGVWSGVEPSCRLIDCGKPEVPSGGDYEGDRFNVDAEIKYKCNAGHKMHGGTVGRKCGSDSKWDGSVPECRFIDCGRVQTILKGEVKYVNTTTYLDSVVQYSCTFGYQLTGSGTRSCQEDGKWTGSSPKCEETRCVPPQIPKNSSVVYSGNDRSTSDSFKVGATVQYRCSMGHIVQGQSLRSCEADGNWSGGPPTCVYIDCSWPYPIANGRWLLTTNTTFYGSTVEYECIGSFKLTGSARRICMENGTWSQMAPSCEVVNCGSPPTKDDKTLVEGDSFTVGEKVTYGCQYGYELVGQEIRNCDSDGQWSHQTPYCRIVDCGRPPVLPNGRGYLLNGTTTFDSVIEYHCMPDFKIIGDPVRRCRATSSWSGALPRCLELSLINELDNGLDTRADRAQGSMYVESSKALGIGIAIGIGALLVLILTIAVVCLKTKKPQPVKNTENVDTTPNRMVKDDPTVMSYSRLSLESEAAAAAANVVNNGAIRHHPNGLVTFSSPNGHLNGNHPNGNHQNGGHAGVHHGPQPHHHHHHGHHHHGHPQTGPYATGNPLTSGPYQRSATNGTVSIRSPGGNGGQHQHPKPHQAPSIPSDVPRFAAPLPPTGSPPARPPKNLSTHSTTLEV